MKWILFLFIFFTVPAHAIDDWDAITAIVGESANEPDCMPMIAGAIKSRGTLRGVYGLNNSMTATASGATYQKAAKAWYQSKEGAGDHWLTPAELKKPSTMWVKQCTEVSRCGSHIYYKCPWEVKK